MQEVVPHRERESPHQVAIQHQLDEGLNAFANKNIGLAENLFLVAAKQFSRKSQDDSLDETLYYDALRGILDCGMARGEYSKVEKFICKFGKSTRIKGLTKKSREFLVDLQRIKSQILTERYLEDPDDESLFFHAFKEITIGENLCDRYLEKEPEKKGHFQFLKADIYLKRKAYAVVETELLEGFPEHSVLENKNLSPIMLYDYCIRLGEACLEIGTCLYHYSKLCANPVAYREAQLDMRRMKSAHPDQYYSFFDNYPQALEGTALHKQLYGLAQENTKETREAIHQLARTYIMRGRSLFQLTLDISKIHLSPVPEFRNQALKLFRKHQECFPDFNLS